VFAIIGITVSLYIILIFQSYKLELSRGLIRESFKGKLQEIRFNDIKSIDCEIYGIIGYPIISAKMELILDNGSSFDFKTSSQAALYDIYLWVKSNYPDAQVTKKVKQFIGGKVIRFLYKSG
jgi:hypothetical protein